MQQGDLHEAPFPAPSAGIFFFSPVHVPCLRALCPGMLPAPLEVGRGEER